jgi:HlyD family secretion protein
MNFKALWEMAWTRARQKPWLAAGVALAAVVLLVVAVRAARPAAPQYTYYAAKRGDFLISIVEGGTVEAVNEVVIRSEVEGTARIIFLVTEGSNVKKGDLLVELDSASSQDAVNLQQINVEKAQFGLIQAEQQLDIQRSTVESEVSAAKLKVEFALSDLEKLMKGEAFQSMRNAQIEITNVLENLKIAEERLNWSEELFKQGYETKANLDKDRLAVSQSKLKLEQAQQALWMLEKFDAPKKQRELEAALQEAKENQDRVKLQGDRKLAQFEADVTTQKSTMELSKKKLERDLKQLQATKIFAPQDGLVVFPTGSGHFSSESMIEEGATVRNRQELIKLPDIAEMKLVVKIHESHINQIQPGQPAYVVLDAMPDRRFNGMINKVAPLPDASSRWGNPNLKVYATEILITEPLPNVKPGVSARAEVVITNMAQVVTVPIQAVTTRKGQQVVYLAGDPPRPTGVTVGMYNTRFIEITAGVKEGDRVLLSPPFDPQEKDLAGAILSADDKVAAGATNRLPKAVINGRNGNGNGNGRSPDNGGPRMKPPGEGAGKVPAAGPGVAADVAGEGRPGGAGGPSEGGGRGGRGGRVMSEEMIKQFDKNGDGQLDETERTAMRDAFGARRRAGGSSNAPVEAPAPNGNR